MIFNQQAYNKFLIANKVLGFFEEPITLKSGRVSNWYANCRDLLDRVGVIDVLTDFVLDFASEKELEADYFYGVPEGATKLAVVLNYKKGKDNPEQALVIGRGKPKEHGSSKDKYFIGPANKGDRVVVIEDVTTTGGSLLTTIEQLQEAGIEVVAAIGLVNRMELRDDGKSVEQAVTALDVPYYAMGDSIKLLPMAAEASKPSLKVLKDVEKYFNKYGINPIKFGEGGGNMEAKDRICLALDVDSMEKAKALVDELHDYVGVYKVGKELFTSVGPQVVKEINSLGGKVFLDLKYHDIPNTAAKAGEAATELGVYMFNIHASGGYTMMEAVANAVRNKAVALGVDRPIVLAVTVLTSIDQDVLNDELNVGGEVEKQVVHLARLAQKAGLDGVVCSPQEIKAIRKACGSDFVIVTPGIRPTWSVTDDQKRITTPKDAVQAGVDYMVIGRPIRNANDRVAAAKKILDEIR